MKLYYCLICIVIISCNSYHKNMPYIISIKYYGGASGIKTELILTDSLIIKAPTKYERTGFSEGRFFVNTSQKFIKQIDSLINTVENSYSSENYQGYEIN